MTEIHPSSLGRFVRAIAVLALPAEGQLEYLVAVGAPENIDDIALEFDDGQLLAEQFVEAGWMSANSRARVADLNSLLDGMSGEDNAELWTALGLRGAEQWRRVRSLARGILYSLR
jgi:hypothetical protein